MLVVSGCDKGSEGIPNREREGRGGYLEEGLLHRGSLDQAIAVQVLDQVPVGRAEAAPGHGDDLRERAVIAGEWSAMCGTGAAEEGVSEGKAVPESGGAESSRHRCELRTKHAGLRVSSDVGSYRRSRLLSRSATITNGQ